AARNMLGHDQPFMSVPYFWSDQYAFKSQYVGYASTWEQVVMRGDLVAGEGIAFYLAGGRVRAALAVNRGRELAARKRLIGAAVDPAMLADEGVDLKALTRRGPAGAHHFTPG